MSDAFPDYTWFFGSFCMSVHSGFHMKLNLTTSLTRCLKKIAASCQIMCRFFSINRAALVLSYAYTLNTYQNASQICIFAVYTDTIIAFFSNLQTFSVPNFLLDLSDLNHFVDVMSFNMSPPPSLFLFSVM